MTNQLEILVRKVARTLHDNQVARLYKIPNDVKLVDGVAIHAERTPVDFIGFTASGRVMLVECKMCNEALLPISSRGLKSHQWIALVEAHKAGGLGLLVWEHYKEIAVIDAAMILSYTAGRKSLPWKIIPPHYRRDRDVEHLRFFWPFLSGQLARSGLPTGMPVGHLLDE